MVLRASIQRPERGLTFELDLYRLCALGDLGLTECREGYYARQTYAAEGCKMGVGGNNPILKDIGATGGWPLTKSVRRWGRAGCPRARIWAHVGSLSN